MLIVRGWLSDASMSISQPSPGRQRPGLFSGFAAAKQPATPTSRSNSALFVELGKALPFFLLSCNCVACFALHANPVRSFSISLRTFRATLSPMWRPPSSCSRLWSTPFLFAVSGRRERADLFDVESLGVGSAVPTPCQPLAGWRSPTLLFERVGRASSRNPQPTPKGCRLWSAPFWCLGM